MTTPDPIGRGVLGQPAAPAQVAAEPRAEVQVEAGGVSRTTTLHLASSSALPVAQAVGLAREAAGPPLDGSSSASSGGVR